MIYINKNSEIKWSIINFDEIKLKLTNNSNISWEKQIIIYNIIYII